MIHSFKICRPNWSQMFFEYGENNELDSYILNIILNIILNNTTVFFCNHTDIKIKFKAMTKKKKKRNTLTVNCKFASFVGKYLESLLKVSDYRIDVHLSKKSDWQYLGTDIASSQISVIGGIYYKTI